MRNPLALRAEVQQARFVYQAVLRTKVSDTAPLDDQHAWWRTHDALKRSYAYADWQWESLVLKTLVGLIVLSAAVAVFALNALIVTALFTAAGLWECYRILSRSAPD